MKRLTSLFLSLTAVTWLFASVAATAQADTTANPDAYREAMTDFVPTVSQWTGWVEMAGSVDDTTLNSSELAELEVLAQLGYGMAADLAGTAELAPLALRDRHDALTSAVERLSDAVTRAAAGKPGAMAGVEADVAAAEQAMLALRTWLLRDTLVPSAPVPGPVAPTS
jgi:hypothetical protein